MDVSLIFRSLEESVGDCMPLVNKDMAIVLSYILDVTYTQV